LHLQTNRHHRRLRGRQLLHENYVKRSEMAAYLAKALGLHWPDA